MVDANRRRTTLWWVAAALGLVAVAWVYPRTPLPSLIHCPSRFVFDFPCPGCGMTRSVVATAQGDVLVALGYHVGGVLLVAGLLVLAFVRVVDHGTKRDIWEGGKKLYRRWESAVWIVLGALIVGYWAVRLFGGCHPDL